MKVKDYQKVATVGDEVSCSHQDVWVGTARTITGYVGEIDVNSFYIWQNEQDGLGGDKNPKSLGFKYSWCVFFDAARDTVEILEDPTINIEVLTDKRAPSCIIKWYMGTYHPYSNSLSSVIDRLRIFGPLWVPEIMWLRDNFLTHEEHRKKPLVVGEQITVANKHLLVTGDIIKDGYFTYYFQGCVDDKWFEGQHIYKHELSLKGKFSYPDFGINPNTYNDHKTYYCGKYKYSRKDKDIQEIQDIKSLNNTAKEQTRTVENAVSRLVATFNTIDERLKILGER